VCYCSTYNSYAELEADFVAQKLHPKDLKAALARTINACVSVSLGWFGPGFGVIVMTSQVVGASASALC
jgi:uncharacterized protein YqgC (DUF456 family)